MADHEKRIAELETLVQALTKRVIELELTDEARRVHLGLAGCAEEGMTRGQLRRDHPEKYG